MKKKVSIYMKNTIDSPSAYYSITQYIRGIKSFNGSVYGLWPNRLFRLFMKPCFRHGIGNIIRKGTLFIVQCVNVVRFMIRDIQVEKPDIIVICRELFPQKMPRIFVGIYKKLLQNRKVIWTFDDNIKMGEISAREWGLLCKNADEIMVTHDYLKETLPQECWKRVSFIPQADGDITRELVEGAKQQQKEKYQKEINLVWVATSSNLPNMHYITYELEQAAKILKEKHDKTLELRIVCNEPYIAQHHFLQVKNILWTRDDAARFIAESHIGIMPLIDNEFNRGKGGFKLVQYLTADLPVIASAVGWNYNVVGEDSGILVKDIEDKSGWVDAIIKLAVDYGVWNHYSLAARKRCEEFFSYTKNLQVWQEKLEQE